MDQASLATAANVSRNTIVNFESGQRIPGGNNLAAIKTALEVAGVIFVPGDGEGPGVRLKKSPASVAAAIDQKIEALEIHLDTEERKPGPSPEAGMQALERARKKDEVVKLKNKRAKLKKG